LYHSAEIDQAVAAAYGWADLDLGHAFHQTKRGLRYTISEIARRTVLDRLLALNHERYAVEVKAGLHERERRRARRRGSGGRRLRRGWSRRSCFRTNGRRYGTMLSVIF
jgi:hypothetical protein